jgi:hypothetical protein
MIVLTASIQHNRNHVTSTLNVAKIDQEGNVHSGNNKNSHSNDSTTDENIPLHLVGVYRASTDAEADLYPAAHGSGRINFTVFGRLTHDWSQTPWVTTFSS